VYTAIDGHEAIEAMELLGTAAVAAPDGMGDACDPCPAQNGSMQSFGQTLLLGGSGWAPTGGGSLLMWPFAADVRWVRGELSSLSAYAVVASGSAGAATFLDVKTDVPMVGTGFWYLVRLAGPCGSWQSAPGNEPGRDAVLR
jgi:hypothetical protein